MNKKAGMISFAIIAIMGVAMLGVGAMYGHGKTVLNDNAYMAMVSHTEYSSGETGQIVARIVDYQSNPIVATCYATIKYPDKSAFVTNQSMTASTIDGDYYYTFTTPTVEGVYEYQANCYYGVNKKQSATNSYHLSPALNTISEINQTVNNLNLQLGGNFTDIYNALVNVNSTIISQISSMNSTMISEFTGLNSSIATQISGLNTSIINEILAVNSSLWNKINSLTPINYTSRFDAIDGNLTLILARESQINSTVTNIWDTLSVTVVNKLDSIISTQVQINNTVNNINTTTNNILTNQENQVYMTVVSG